MKIKRRDFLKISGAAGVALTVQMPVLNAFSAKTKADGQAPGGAEALEGQWIASTCQSCTAWCPIEVLVQDGRAVKVRGNHLCKANNGFCCPKGHMGLQLVYDPDRIKMPLKRTNPEKGKGIDPRFVPITWDEAMDTIAEKMVALRNNGESHKFLLMRGRYSPTTTYISYGRFPEIYGSPNNISHSAICAEGEKFGPYFTEGFWGYRDYDLANTKYLLIWGCDPLSSNRQLPNSIHRFGALLDYATVAVVDPRFSNSAAKGHHWLPIKPGEDGALAVALAHEILKKGLWNREFVGDFKDGKNRFVENQTVDEALFDEIHSYGLVRWWNLALKDKTPAWAAEITGIEKDLIIKVADGMGRAAPRVAVWLGPGPVMSPRGAYTSSAIHALNGLLGSVDNVGGTLRQPSLPVGKLPDADAYMDDVARAGRKQPKIDQRGTKKLPAMARGRAGSGVVTNNVPNAILADDPYDIKVAIGYWNNFNFSGHDTRRWDAAMTKLPFYVQVTTHASEMAQFADIVLPAPLSPYEQINIMTNKANTYAHVSIQQPVIKRLWDTKPFETEIVWLLAEKMKAKGFANLFDYFSKEFKDPETGRTPTSPGEFAEIAAKMFSHPVWAPEKPLKGDKIDGWADFKKKGIYNSEPYNFRQLWGNFGTVTKKFEFYSETLKKGLAEHAANHNTDIDDILVATRYTCSGELAFVPHYEPPLRVDDERRFPFLFIDYKSRLNGEGRSQNAPWYYEFKKVDLGDEKWEDVIKINPQDATKIGVQTGDTVRVTSIAGSIVVKAKLWEGIRPGTVTKCFGQGHWAYGRLAAKDYKNAVPRGGNNNDLIPDVYEPLTGSSARNGGFFGVRIEKIQS
jgi:anaerobic selenocysteine-containing dehydrogenase